ncbi:MAG: hypothetical protein JW769_02605 [Parachlamydiales bacterium]|nr:hypothetical protein [Parachlamydiales bacterium]
METALFERKISREVFEKEKALCKMLSKENGGKCHWGICKNCGVLPLLHKLHTGKLIESPEEVANMRKEILQS